NLNTQTFEAVSPQSVRNIAPIQLSRTTTIELGYQGMPSKEVVLRIDVYYENTKNPLGAYVVQTPNVFYDYESLRSYLSAYLPADTAVKYAQTISSLPLGTITPMEGDPADLLVATRSFGDVSFFGGDVAITYAPSPSFSVAANYSFLSKNFFEKTASDYDDISLNAPKHKLGFTGSYSNEALGFTGEIRVRYVDSYFVLSGIGRETIPSCTLADINASYRIPFLPSATLLCSVQNLFDTRHQEYIGAPKIGRLALFRLAYALL
ncbi:MAG: TonB-dependent receptor, partial [Ignavibacteriales bacterium]|nr:TonB-dependent receptor [Ignavibacteriales bacterium]